jgi:hypothetical protein
VYEGSLALKLVLVYLGRHVPSYVFLNLILLQRNFPQYDVVFLSDFQHNLHKAEKMGVTTKKVPYAEEYKEITPDQLSWDMKFRDFFWYKTLARFFALSYYLSSNPDSSILHIEADVLLLPNFPLEKVSKIGHPLSFPLETLNQAVASTLFIKNKSALEHLISFAADQAQIDPRVTDMTILAKYRLSHPERVLVMPTAPGRKDAFVESGFTEQIDTLSGNLDYFGGLFDATTWGQYLTGIDERNSRGFRKTYHFQSHHAINTTSFHFLFENSLSVRIHEETFHLFALHVHSKNLNLFKVNKWERTLKKFVTLSRFGPRNKLVFSSFFKIVYAKIVSIVLK